MTYINSWTGQDSNGSDPTDVKQPTVVDEANYNTFESNVSKEELLAIAVEQCSFDEENFNRLWKPEMLKMIPWLGTFPKGLNGTPRLTGNPRYLSETYPPYRMMCSWEWDDKRIAFVFDIAEYL